MINLRFSRKVMFSQHSFSFCNFNFDLKNYFLNISHLKFEKIERKVPENNEEKRKLVNNHFSTIKPIVFYIKGFYSTRKVRW
jgi:hypothetical protein